MSRFLRVFLFSLICFSVAAFAGITVYSKMFDTKPLPIPETQVEKLDLNNENPFEKSVLEGKRLNTLILGVNEDMTDTILVCSFNIDTKETDIISIPRDTYYHRKGYNGAADKKVNSVYREEGIARTIDVVQAILGDKIPIHHHAVVKYEGVEKMVDLLGGVKVDVPVDMKYDDPTDVPPLKIRLKKGEQLLDGKEAISFLRFRKNNDGTGYIDGDLGRIKTQQQFIKAFIKKSMGPKLPSVIKTGINHVDTDVSMKQGLSYASKIIGVDSDDIKMMTIPGVPEYIKGISYFVYDEKQTKELVESLYEDTVDLEDDEDSLSDKTNDKSDTETKNKTNKKDD